MDIFNQYLTPTATPTTRTTRNFEQGGQTYSLTYLMAASTSPRRRARTCPGRLQGALPEARQGGAARCGPRPRPARTGRGSAGATTGRRGHVIERGAARRTGGRRRDPRPAGGGPGGQLRLPAARVERDARRGAGCRGLRPAVVGAPLRPRGPAAAAARRPQLLGLPRIAGMRSVDIRVTARALDGASGTLRDTASVSMPRQAGVARIRRQRTFRVRDRRRPRTARAGAAPGGVTG